MTVLLGTIRCPSSPLRKLKVSTPSSLKQDPCAHVTTSSSKSVPLLLKAVYFAYADYLHSACPNRHFSPHRQTSIPLEKEADGPEKSVGGARNRADARLFLEQRETETVPVALYSSKVELEEGERDQGAGWEFAWLVAS